MSMYLAGDIGGTKTLLAIFQKKGSELLLIFEKRIPSSEWSNLNELLINFLRSSGINSRKIDAGCLSFAGPIQNQICRLVNLNRTINLGTLQELCEFPLLFCNDLVAMGHGMFTLNPNDFLCLNPSVLSFNPFALNSSSNQNRAVIAPGTGLGESIIINDYIVSPTEGAHVDFAARTELEIKLWRFLVHEYGHVSYERILSGPGLMNIYRFFLSELTGHEKPSLSPADITQKGLDGTCPLCVKTLNLFTQILGAEVGNLALKSLALGGVFLGGGIPPKILPKLQDNIFLNAFQDKGRFSELVKSIPVFVLLNEKTALYGAARIAIRGLLDYPTKLSFPEIKVESL